MSTEEAKVVKKIKAKTPAAKSTKSEAKAKPTKEIKKEKAPRQGRKEGYFRGAWRELRQVHWTNRRATWKLTLAVLAFSFFFIVLILLCDYAFDNLMKLLIS